MVIRSKDKLMIFFSVTTFGAPDVFAHLPKP